MACEAATPRPARPFDGPAPEVLVVAVGDTREFDLVLPALPPPLVPDNSTGDNCTSGRTDEDS